MDFPLSINVGLMRPSAIDWHAAVCMLLKSLSFQLQNEKRRLERDLEEIKKQKEEQEDENERLRQEVASLR